ncbi:hypothetical protein B0H10DRAFT_2079468 [Mycena sp. CBHHK59/15]|nr:hypothetical protein B0H10DRAFT_2079468 [Mycena sp. CBHHK59/15]
MEGAYAQSQPVPRLRLSRQQPASRSDHPGLEQESHAGPSRPRDHPVDPTSHFDGDAATHEEHQPTPRGPQPISNASPPAEAAARLRALLSRIPNQSKTPVARPVSPSEVESDFDPPRFSPTTPSFAKESLKDIFSRALRDPGDTPIKSRPRRNSIDTSEVEASPRVRERAKNKGKRKSLSDEEAEKPSRSSQRSEASFRSSQAATFDILRERLANSHTPIKNQAALAPLYNNSSTDDTNDTANFLRDLNSSRATPPAATSTPPHSMEMSADFKYQSNLMDHDSEMQHIMKGMDSYEGDSGPSRPISFPPSRGKAVRPGSANLHSSTSHSQSHRTSFHASRPSSQISTHSSTDSQHDQPDRIHELEREWNKPQPKAPPRGGLERHHSHGPANARSSSPVATNGHALRTRTRSGGSIHSIEDGGSPKGTSLLANVQSNSPVTTNGHTVRTRTKSGGSIHSTDDGGSSKGTSFGSQSDYTERLHELEKERNAEREHGWNKPHVARSTSSLSVHSPVERSRKNSHSPRPGSSQSVLHPGISRSHSTSSSRTSSDEEEEIKHEIEHERERNWGAPLPRWNQHPLPAHHSHTRSTSPLPPTSSSPSTSSNLRSTGRVRAESLRTRGTNKGDSPVHRNESLGTSTSATKNAHATPASQSQARPSSLRATAANPRPRPMSYPARPNSPLPPIERKPQPVSHTSSSFAHGLPSHSRSPERERAHSRIPSSPSPSPGKRAANRSSMSHIPIRKTQNSSSGTTNGHSRIPADLQNGVLLILHLRYHASVGEDQCSSPVTETDDEIMSTEEHTPTLRTIPPPVEPTERGLPSLPIPDNVNDDALFQKALALAPPPSPPPSPPTPRTVHSEAPSTILTLLSTPPKRPSFSTSRLEFQTPSPPRGLPDLPGPPSSSDEETETERATVTPPRFNGVHDITSSKTPKPPGAWVSTPAPMVRAHSMPVPENDAPRVNGVPDITFSKTPKAPGSWASTPAPVTRAHSMPAPEHEDSDSQCESGLATPVASLSRASSLPAQTPKPPGAWMTTQTPRKSILKVRFNPQPTELELSTTETLPSTDGHPEELLQTPATGLATPDEDSYFRPHTPELPAAPISPSRSPRRSPTIRVVDEYGRPDKSKPVKSPKNRNKNPVRIVDAMGREVETTEQTKKTEIFDDIPMKPDEALRAVREGVSELVQGLDELDISGDFVALDENRLRELDNASRAAREAREGLKQTFQSDRTAQLRASMQHSKSRSEMHRGGDSHRSPSRFWFWASIIILQAIFLLLFYRMLRKSTKELFLETYYDPFYPDLHRYSIVKQDYIRLFLRTRPSIASLTNTLRQDGIRAFVVNLFDMAFIIFAEWRADTWKRWGGDELGSVRWPPS